MQFECLDPADMPVDVWAAYTNLRDAALHQQDPFFHPEFARLVSETRSDVRILLASEAGDPIGFWPIHPCKGGWARPIGGPFSDWHGPILRAGSALTAQDFLKGAGLCGMTVHGLQPSLHGSALPGASRVAANMTCLADGFAHFAEQQQKKYPKHFKKMRRVTRNAKRDFSEVLYTLDDRDEAAFEWLIKTKRAQYIRTGKHDVLASDWSAGLLDRLRHTGREDFGVMLSTLRFDGKIAAAELNIHGQHILHSWLTAFATDFSYYSPGYLLEHGVLERMHARGFDLYDTGSDLDYYKKFYTNFVLPIDQGVIISGHKSPAPQRVLGAGWRAAEQVLPGRMSGLMGKVRRRTDQILMAEPAIPQRASGFLQAVKLR